MKSTRKKKNAGSKESKKKKPAKAPPASSASVASVPPVSSSHPAPQLRGRHDVREDDDRPSWQRRQERIAISRAFVSGLSLRERDIVMATASEPLQHREHSGMN
jgi:hypothetical protein